MYVFISPHFRIFSANSEKVWNTWAVSKSCEVVQEFASKLKILFLKSCVSLVSKQKSGQSPRAVRLFRRRTWVLRRAPVTCCIHYCAGISTSVHFALSECDQVTSIYTFIWIAGFYPVIVCKVTCRTDHLLTSSICVQSLIWGIRCCPVMWLRVSSCHRIGCNLKWVTSWQVN